MAVHSRGGRRTLASPRDSDADFTVLMDRSSVASSFPPPPQSQARPATRREAPRAPPPQWSEPPPSVSRPPPPPEPPRAARFDRTPVPLPPRREPIDPVERSSVISRPIPRGLRDRLDQATTSASDRRRRWRATVTMFAIGLLSFGASVGAVVESFVSPRNRAASEAASAALAASAPLQCTPPTETAPSASATSAPAPEASAAPAPTTHHRHRRAGDAARAAASAAASDPTDTSATQDDFAAAADALEKAKQETTLP